MCRPLTRHATERLRHARRWTYDGGNNFFKGRLMDNPLELPLIIILTVDPQRADIKQKTAELALYSVQGVQWICFALSKSS
eukprot:scaffold401_cov144-Skeletonema_dohrnii-CCMP3373.AAC.24